MAQRGTAQGGPAIPTRETGTADNFAHAADLRSLTLLEAALLGITPDAATNQRKFLDPRDFECGTVAKAACVATPRPQ